jgi:short-subunit dehydrogenase
MAYALITGASKGIGKEIANELAIKGYDLLLIARNSYELQMVK